MISRREKPFENICIKYFLDRLEFRVYDRKICKNNILPFSCSVKLGNNELFGRPKIVP